MKQFRKVFTLAAVLAGMLLLTGCSKKNPMSAEDFSAAMEEKGYTVTDITSQYESYQVIESALLAVNSDGSYQIEFYVLSEEKWAVNMYQKNVEIFQEQKSSVAVESSVDIGNHSRYNLVSGGSYMLVSRIDNTLIYVKADGSHSDEIKEALKGTGY